MGEQKDKHCDTCKFAKDLTTMKVYEVEVEYMTCWRDLPHVCYPCNTCNFWEPREDDDGRR